MVWAYALESGQVPGFSLGSNFTVSEVTQRSVVGCHAGEIVVRGTVSSTGSVDGLWSAENRGSNGYRIEYTVSR
jgi:hypothetical protein